MKETNIHKQNNQNKLYHKDAIIWQNVNLHPSAFAKSCMPFTLLGFYAGRTIFQTSFFF